MGNFLNIPWQEEAINKENVVLRGARGSGKTYCAMRWAIKQMQKGKKVAYLIGSPRRYQPVKREFIDVLRCHNIEVSGTVFNMVAIEGGGAISFISVSSSSSIPVSIEQESIVMDDADNIRPEIIRMYHLNPRAQYFIAGTKDHGIMSSFLKNEWRPIYMEFNRYHMEGFMQVISKDRWRKWYGNMDGFYENYGPWRLEGNKHNKFVLDKYDS